MDDCPPLLTGRVISVPMADYLAVGLYAIESRTGWITLISSYYGYYTG